MYFSKITNLFLISLSVVKVLTLFLPYRYLAHPGWPDLSLDCTEQLFHWQMMSPDLELDPHLYHHIYTIHCHVSGSLRDSAYPGLWDSVQSSLTPGLTSFSSTCRDTSSFRPPGNVRRLPNSPVGQGSFAAIGDG